MDRLGTTQTPTIGFESFCRVFGEERSLPDGSIEGQNVVSWQRFLTVLNGMRWGAELSGDVEDNSTGPFNVLQLFPASGDVVTLKVFLDQMCR